MKFDALLNQAQRGSLPALHSGASGQNLLREALLIADHNAYHTG